MVKKKTACNAGDPGPTPGLGRFPGEGNGTPLQYPCLGNWTEKPGGLQSMELQRVRHDWVTNTLHLGKAATMGRTWGYPAKGRGRLERKALEDQAEWIQRGYRQVGEAILDLPAQLMGQLNAVAGVKEPVPHGLSLHTEPSPHSWPRETWAVPNCWGLPCGPMAKTLYSQCKGPEFDPCSGN